MKFSSIAGICKKDKTVVLYEASDAGGIQWIGNGMAAYPVYGLPYLTEESVFTIFDIQEKQRGGWAFKRDKLPKGICFEDNDDSEKPVMENKFTIMYAGCTFKPLHTNNGIVFVESRYVNPLGDVLDAMEFYERTSSASGMSYIVAKVGFLLQAVIFPFDIVNDEFVKHISLLADKCRTMYDRKQEEMA